MSNNKTVIRIRGLSKLDRIELDQTIGSDSVTFENDTLDSGEYGEPVTTMAVVVVAIPTIAALAAWALKHRNSEFFEETIEIVHPNGEKETKHIKRTASSSSPPSADILQQFASIFKVDLNALTEWFRSLSS